MPDAVQSLFGWERAMMAADKVMERLRRAVRALEAAGIPYAVAGGHAVAEWVGRVDEEAVRTTRDVDLLVRRADFPAVRSALESAGFIHHHVMDVDTFIDGPDGKPSGGVHLLYAGQKVRAHEPYPSPELDESERAAEFPVTTLAALVQMKLMAWCNIDRTHLRDLLDVGLIDPSWPARYPAPLDERLQQLLDDPQG